MRTEPSCFGLYNYTVESLHADKLLKEQRGKEEGNPIKWNVREGGEKVSHTFFSSHGMCLFIHPSDSNSCQCVSGELWKAGTRPRKTVEGKRWLTADIYIIYKLKLNCILLWHWLIVGAGYIDGWCRPRKHRCLKMAVEMSRCGPTIHHRPHAAR